MSDIFTDMFGAGLVGGSVGVDLMQAAQIQEVGQDANHANSRADRATVRAAEAEQKLARLQIVTQAMWEFLRERAELTDEMLEAKILEIDLRDGKKDGKMGTEVVNCSQCQRKTGVRRRSCFYCGAELEATHVVER